MRNLINEVHVTGNCTCKGFNDKKSTTSIKPTWYEQDATTYEYCEDGIGSAKRYYRKLKVVTTTTTRNPIVTTTTTRNPIVTNTYSVCSGPTYSNGCKDSGAPNPNGIIYKVQGCIGASQDSKFGPKTEKALKAKTGKTTFKESDVENICKGVSVDDQSPNNQGGTIQKPEEQKQFFEKLESRGRIGNGYIQQLAPEIYSKSGSFQYEYTYVKKYECVKDGDKIVSVGNEIPITSKSDVVNSDKFLYILLFSDLVYGIMTNKGRINMLGYKGKWSPDDAGASNIFMESKRNRKRYISEQNIDFSEILGTAWSFNPSSTTNQGSSSTTNQGSSSSNVTSNFNEAVETEKVMGPIKEKALKIIDEWDESNSKKLAINPAKGRINTEIDNARAQIQGKNPKDFCSPQNKAELAKAKEDIAKKKAELRLALSKEDESYMGQLESLLGQVESQCSEIEKKKRQSQNTSSNQGSGSQGSGSQGSPTVVSGSRKDELRKLFGFVDKDGNTRNPKSAVMRMNKIPEKGINGGGSIQFAINNYDAKSEWFEDYNELMDAEGLSEYKLRFPDDYEVTEFAGQVIDKENYADLVPRKSDAREQYKRFTFGKFLETESNLEIYQVQSGTGEAQTIGTQCKDEPEVVREKLKNYLEAAFSADRKFRGNQKELDYFERCLVKRKLDKKTFEPFREEDFETVDRDRLPFGVFAKRLALSDVIKLLRGDVVNGIEIMNSSMVDPNFYSTGRAVYESINNVINRRISEAVRKKKMVNETLVMTALKKLVK